MYYYELCKFVARSWKLIVNLGDNNRLLRKVTKNKGVFPNDTALIKLVYLAYRNARKKWTMPVPNWALSHNSLR